MRIISGKFRGKKLFIPLSKLIRPTQDRTKEALFSIIQFRVSGCKFLDLFSGSGQIGIEAISRGAERVVFVDSNKDALSAIKENLTGIKSSSLILESDAIEFLKNTEEKFDICYLDPPYESDLILKSLPLVAKIMEKEGMIICESKVGFYLPETVGKFILKKKYKYGKAIITMYMEETI